jgi:peptide-methionine (S)-S-oxide reductase
MSRFGNDPRTLTLPTPAEALPGRQDRMPVPAEHFVTQARLERPFPDGTEEIVLGMGCFWGAERAFWEIQGVYTTAVGYSGGSTPHPTYQEVCSGQTGHNEVVLVVFYRSICPFERLLQVFWEGHDPTQGMRQGNDVGTQYRSGIYWTTEPQRLAAESSRDAYQRALTDAGYEKLSTEIARAGEFYYAEEYHQQYLAKNPGGYCGLGGTGVSCRAGLDTPS